MPRCCSYCGKTLQQARDLTHLWLTPYECTGSTEAHHFLEVGDARWVYPLLELQVGVMARLKEADNSLLEIARSRIHSVDYKTVSIVGFEHTLLGCYREQDHVAAR